MEAMRIEEFHVPNPPPRGEELPSDDGEPLETERHVRQMTLLIESLSDAWSDRHDYYVNGNMFVYYSEAQAREAIAKGTTKYRGPDVFVVLDTDRHERKSWVAWEEGGKLPDVIVEITSPTTAHVDRGIKKEIYAGIWRTAIYVIYDPLEHTLEGYALDPIRRVYRPLEPLPGGDLPIGPLGLALGLRDLPQDHLPGPFLRWIDASGAPLPSGRERAGIERARADEQRARADEERARADAAEARVRELEAALARKR